MGELVFVAENILVFAAVQLIVKSSFSIVVLFIGILGFVLSIQFILIQKGSHIYATARFNRWKELEELLSKPLTGKSGKFMGILSSQEAEISKHKWYKPPLTTWSVRKYVPIVFLIFWAIFIGASLLFPGHGFPGLADKTIKVDVEESSKLKMIVPKENQTVDVAPMLQSSEAKNTNTKKEKAKPVAEKENELDNRIKSK